MSAKEINIKFPGQILDYVDTKEHLLELFNYITNLQEENKHLDKVNCHLRKKINSDIYKSRNEKAIEYITSEETINMFSSINAREKWLKINHKLLNILQGE